MPRIDIDLSWAITTLDLPGSVDIHACQRVSYTSLLPPGRHTLADVVELAKRRLNVIRAGGGLGYIGATRDALDRFHGVNAHFPLLQRFMEVLAFAHIGDHRLRICLLARIAPIRWPHKLPRFERRRAHPTHKTSDILYTCTSARLTLAGSAVVICVLRGRIATALLVVVVVVVVVAVEERCRSRRPNRSTLLLLVQARSWNRRSRRNRRR